MDKQEAIERLKQNKAAAKFYAGMVQNTNEIKNELKDIEAIRKIVALSQKVGGRIGISTQMRYITILLVGRLSRGNHSPHHTRRVKNE